MAPIESYIETSQKREVKEERFSSLSTTVAETSTNLSLNRWTNIQTKHRKILSETLYMENSHLFWKKICLSRYYNVLAYDQSRVLLTHEDKEVYVNANRVKVAAADREYILTQGGWDL